MQRLGVGLLVQCWYRHLSIHGSDTKMARQAIRREGDKAEAVFLKLVNRARSSDKSKRGDVIVPVDGKDFYVEIKECHAEPNKAGTINQVRPIKYICCAIWAPEHGCWYVLSPDQLVRYAAEKSRGHHNEIPFECMNFSLRSLGEEYHTKCKGKDLETVVVEAVRRGEKHAMLRGIMNDTLREIRAISEKYKQAVKEYRS